MRRLFVACTAALAVSACAGAFAERVSPAEFYPAYTPAQFGSFAAAGPVVEIHGPRPGGADDAAIAAALRAPQWFAQAPFSAAPAGEPPEGRQRIILNFGEAGGMNTISACRGRVSPGGVVDRLAVAAAYCIGTRPASAARLVHDAPLTPDDPAFGDAMARLFAEMFPNTDPRGRGDNDRNRSRIIPPRP